MLDKGDYVGAGRAQRGLDPMGIINPSWRRSRWPKASSGEPRQDLIERQAVTSQTPTELRPIAARARSAPARETLRCCIGVALLAAQRLKTIGEAFVNGGRATGQTFNPIPVGYIFTVRAWNSHFAIVQVPRTSALSGPPSSASTLNINFILPASDRQQVLTVAFGLAGMVWPRRDVPNRLVGAAKYIVPRLAVEPIGAIMLRKAYG